jgi:Tol biopolymer transport system component
VGRWLAPGLSIAGLLIVAYVTLNLLNNNIPFVGGSKANGNGNGNPAQTPAPSNVVIVPPEVVSVPGSIVYAKAGNIWIQTGKEAHQLTSGGDDSMPSWSPDGSAVYFIRDVGSDGSWPMGGVVRDYRLTTPSVMRVKADGSGKPELMLSGKITRNNRTWHSWIRQPVLSPDGHTLALVSDRPDPTKSDVVLQFYDIVSKASKNPKVANTSPLGHQDPAWRPDGKVLLYVRNGRDGSRGAPSIYRWDVAKGIGTAFTGPGYLEPAFSPDGKYVAATKTSAFGNDLVILDGTNGRELMRVTNDAASWAPVWSPAGDAIAFLHIDGQIVDLRLVRLEGSGPNWTVKDTIDLTEVSGLEGASRPSWYVPPDQLPAPTPTPVPTAAPTSSPSTAP